MMNEELILKIVAPYVKNNSITYDEFENLFSMLEKKEQYEVTDILFVNNIELRPEEDEKARNENREESNKSEKYSNEEVFMDSATSDELEMNMYIKQSNEVLCSLIQEGNKQAEQDLCIKNRGLVDKYATRYRGLFGNKLDFEDIEQMGYIGLIKAAKKFEISRGDAFSTCAVWWIRQAILREIYDAGFTIRIPVHMMECIRKIQNYENLLDSQTQQIDYKNKLKIIAEKMGKSIDFVKMCIEIREKYLACSSLNTHTREEGETELEEMIADTQNPSIEDIIIEKDLKNQINKTILSLGEREREVLELRFGLTDGKTRTLEEVGKIYGITRERVRQIEAKALRKMRHPTRNKNIKDFLVG